MNGVSVPALLFGGVIIYGIWIMIIEPLIGGTKRHPSHDNPHHRR